MDTLTALLGTTPAIFIGLTVVLVGGAAILTGRAIGGNWKPAWQVVLTQKVLLGSSTLAGKLKVWVPPSSNVVFTGSVTSAPSSVARAKGGNAPAPAKVALRKKLWAVGTQAPSEFDQ